MSGIPPQLSANPGTPSTEWAAKTTSALETDPATPNATVMNPTTRQLFEEKNMRPGTTATETFGNPMPPVAAGASTPGREVPGAYPQTPGEDSKDLQARGAELTSQATDAASRVAQTVQETAAAYLPRAAETVGQYLPKGMADTLASYIPGTQNPQGTVIASLHDDVHTKSLPSTELRGATAGEHVGGVGALPGTLAETGVSRLPDERDPSQEWPTAAGAAVTARETAQGAAQGARETAQGTAQTVRETAAGTAQGARETAQGTAEGAQSTVQGIKEKVAQYAPAALVGGAAAATLPSKETHGQQPFEHTDGVGALPGKPGETGVATLPDENARGATVVTSTATGTHNRAFGNVTLPSQEGDRTATELAGGVGRLPGSNTEQGVAVLPDERGGAGAVGATLPSHELHGQQPFERTGGVGALPGKRTEPAVAALPDEHTRGATGATSAGVGTHARSLDNATLPSRDDSHHGITGGVGSLPGMKEEHGVAVLPDQREASHKSSLDKKTGEDTAMADAARTAGVRSAETTDVPKTKQGEKQAEKAGAAAIGAKVGEQEMKHEHEKKVPHGKPNQGDAYDTDYHPAALHPPTEDYSKEHAKQQQEKEPAAEKDNEKPLTGAKHADSKQASHAEGTGSATDHDDQKKQKVGFMAKMKGEAKILIGKVEGKKGHDKVEEGQKIKAGEPVQ